MRRPCCPSQGPPAPARESRRVAPHDRAATTPGAKRPTFRAAGETAAKRRAAAAAAPRVVRSRRRPSSFVPLLDAPELSAQRARRQPVGRRPPAEKQLARLGIEVFDL